MSKNCLITRLKAVVNDSSLEILGQQKIYVSEQSGKPSPSLILKTNDNVELECTDSLVLGGQQVLTLAPNIEHQLGVKGSGYLLFKDKYSIVKINNYNADIVTDLAQITSMMSLSIFDIVGETIYGDVAKFLNSNIAITELCLESALVFGNLSEVNTDFFDKCQNFRINSPSVECNISQFANNKALTKFRVNDAFGVTGDIALLPNKQSITSFNIYGSGIYGSLESYISSAISSGKSSATDFSMTGVIDQLTFGGVKQTQKGRFSAPCFVTWDSNGKIIIKSGEYSMSDCTHIYCKNATSAEISAWQSAGKTVIQV